jgi:uncharacterized protein (DUF58 family)
VTVLGRLLSPSLVSRLHNLQLHARTVAEGALSGLHRAAHHGASVEFAEHKEYAPGDELRHIDWRAYGRVDKYYVKRFEEETELRGYLLLDTSASMGYGQKGHVTKLAYGQVLCAALAYLLLRQKDPAGLLCFGEAPGTYLPPRGQAAHLSDLCAALLHAAPQGGSDLSRALTYLSEMARRRSLIVVVSDLFPSPQGPDRPDEGQAHAQALAHAMTQMRARLAGLRARRHDVIVLHTLDPDELELPFEGPTWFEDIEPRPSGPRRILADPADVRRAYLAELTRFIDDTRRGLRESDVEYHLVPTRRPPQDVLLELLRGPLRGRIRR